jgi:hypothetical protein
MKKIFSILLLIFITVVSFSGAAAAASVTAWSYETFSLQTPGDWTRSKSEDGYTMSFADPTDKAAVTLTIIGPVDETDSRVAAENYRRSIIDMGYTPSELWDNGDGLFYFELTDQDGDPHRFLIGVIGRRFINIEAGGKDPNLPDILKSLKIKIPFRPNMGNFPDSAEGKPENIKFWSNDHFQISAPKDWKEMKDGDSYAYLKEDKSAGVYIMLTEPLEEGTSESFARKWKDQSKCSEMTDNGDGLFYLGASGGGPEGKFLAGRVLKSGIVIGAIGDNPDVGASLRTLILKLMWQPEVMLLIWGLRG